MNLLTRINETKQLILFNGKLDNILKAKKEILDYYTRCGYTLVQHASIDDIREESDRISTIYLSNASDKDILDINTKRWNGTFIVFNNVTDDYSLNASTCAGVIFTDDISIFKDNTDDFKYATANDFTACKIRCKCDDIHISNKINILRPFYLEI